MANLGNKLKRIGSRKRGKDSPRSSLASASDQGSTLSGDTEATASDRTPSERVPGVAAVAPATAPAPAPKVAPEATPEAAPEPQAASPLSRPSSNPLGEEPIPLELPGSPLDRATPEQALEIRASGGKTFVFKRPASSAASNSAGSGSSKSPLPGSPLPGSAHQSSPGLKKHTSFVEPRLQRSSSLAQLAREKRQSSLNDTRHFYQSNLSVEPGLRPSLSRKSSYADDKRALEYMSNKGSAEGSNLMYRTGSRIWDANKESGFFSYDAGSRISSGRPSRRTSIDGSAEDSEEEDDEEEELHPGRFMSPQYVSDDDDEQPEFADSYLIRAADWLLGIPHDSPLTLRNTLKKRPKKLSLSEKRRYRESTVTDDPAFLLAAYLSIKELM